jgi:microsomal epoxide hydrolase
MRRVVSILLLVTSLCSTAAAVAADKYFTTSDGVRLHYTDIGSGQALLFVPGWTMPGWIFDRQVAAFAPRHRVIVLDPRGQGDSEAPARGYDSDRRGQDIGELLALIGPARPVVIGWSLGVLDTLAYVHRVGDAALAGLVLIDNSVGEDPPPPPPAKPYRKAPKQTHEAFMSDFVRGMFARPQPPAYLQRLTQAALRTPEFAANAMLSINLPRTYWKEAVYSTAKPVLYVVRPKFAGQAGNLAAHHPAAETVVVDRLGHALFADDPGRFNAILDDFLRRRVRP